MQSSTATLRVALVPRTSLLSDALLVVGGAAFVALAAQVSIPLGFTPVPITGQTFAVLLVGASFGSVRGAASMLLYLLVGIAGAPVYSEQKHGWEVFTGATGGYIVGFVVAAWLIGLLAEKGWDKRFSSSLSAMLIGSVVIYGFGLLWLYNHLNVSWSTALEFGLYPFVLGDLIKLFLAALALPSAWQLVRRLKS